MVEADLARHRPAWQPDRRMGPRRILVTGAAGFVGRHLRAGAGQALPRRRHPDGRFDMRRPRRLPRRDPRRAAPMPASISPPSPRSRRRGATRRRPGRSICTARCCSPRRCSPRRRAACFCTSPRPTPTALSFRAGVQLDEGGAARADEHLRRHQGGGRPGARRAGRAGAARRCGSARSTIPARASPRISWSPPSRASSRGSRPGCSRRCCASAGSTPRATSSTCATSAPPMSPACAPPRRCRPARSSTSPPASRPIGNVLDELVALAGLRPRIEEDASRLRPTEIPAASGSAAAAASLLGWHPSVPWERTLRDVLDYWRAEVAGLTPPPSAASSPPDAPSDRTPPR